MYQVPPRPLSASFSPSTYYVGPSAHFGLSNHMILQGCARNIYFRFCGNILSASKESKIFAASVCVLHHYQNKLHLAVCEFVQRRLKSLIIFGLCPWSSKRWGSTLSSSPVSGLLTLLSSRMVWTKKEILSWTPRGSGLMSRELPNYELLKPFIHFKTVF